MQSIVADPFTCVLVVAAEYLPGFGKVTADAVARRCNNAFSEVVICETHPETTLKDIKAETGGKGGKKIVLLLQGPVAGKAVRYLCDDDADKPIEERRVVWIHSLSVGLDYYRFFDFPQLIENIPITNGKRSQSRPLAEHVLYAIGYFNRMTWEWKQNKREHRWAKSSMQEMHDQKMLILGYGDIGEQTAKLALAYGMEVSAVKRNLPAHHEASPYIDRFGAKVYTEQGHDDATEEEAAAAKAACDRERTRLIAESDYIVNIMPGTPETMKFFNKERFATMKKTALYINIGRGCTNNEDDLVAALSDNQLRGAALDVFDVEPLDKNSPLWDVPDEKLMLTCHSAAQTADQLPSLVNRFVSLAERWKSGEEIYSEGVNRKFWY